MFRVVNTIEKKYDFNVILTFENEIEICKCISDENQNLIKKLIEKKEFKGAKNEVLESNFMMNNSLITMIFVGMGKKESFTSDIYRELLFKALSNKKGDILISSDFKELLDYNILGEIVSNVNYNFDRFKEEKGDKIFVDLFIEGDKIDFSETSILSEATDITRELVNLPANIINPVTLAEKVKKLGIEYGFEVEIFDEKECEKLNMNLLLAVGRASVTKPRLIVMKYLNGTNDNERIGLVGKGLTYDSGGLCVKSGESMLEMKTDMAGAGAVIGTMCAVAKNKLKKNVIAVIPACENSISGNSYRPGDIIQSMNGKYVEIINTDAEGRLALADALTYIVRNEKVTEIVDVATLTGAIMVALGTSITGVYSNNTEKYNLLEKASQLHGEKIWRMPLFDEFSDDIKSTVADVKHMGTRWGGANTAAKFLEIFVENTPWIHMDVGGTPFNSDIKWLKKEATGSGVKSLYSYIKNR